MSETVSYLKGKGLRTEGIFRRSARVQLIKDIKKLYNLGKPVDFDQYADVHVPAVMLKSFLRELPSPCSPSRCTSRCRTSCRKCEARGFAPLEALGQRPGEAGQDGAEPR
ncbi:hypothetical protein ANANG_G00313550 [Anguilla anguilla]|uniref:Rho-GAP domain-containing protein n=1 Tax=Anguilla anguilla TaxID=7936 RepID=A0A9D3RHT2_ANGAN|nr:hypothetical protein ANANG_G00313550 [Anguilla anguilla]